MDAGDNEAADHHDAGSEPPLTVEVLADLQAGVLDDRAAGRVRRRVRADPHAAEVLNALNRVRRDVAAVGADLRAGPDAPPQVVARISAAFGTVALLHAPEPAPTTPGDIQHITVSTPPMEIPLSQNEILALLNRSPDYGALADPARRASCLTGLGYPAGTQVLGARPVEINARPGIVLVIPGDSPRVLTVYAVSVTCSAADTGLLASTTVARP